MASTDPILITCFSKQEDKLSQWRTYGQDGYGVAIGFDLNKIMLLQDKEININVKDRDIAGNKTISQAYERTI